MRSSLSSIAAGTAGRYFFTMRKDVLRGKKCRCEAQLPFLMMENSLPYREICLISY